jgi:hypothetical protein
MTISTMQVTHATLIGSHCPLNSPTHPATAMSACTAAMIPQARGVAVSLRVNQ